MVMISTHIDFKVFLSLEESVGRSSGGEALLKAAHHQRDAGEMLAQAVVLPLAPRSMVLSQSNCHRWPSGPRSVLAKWTGSLSGIVRFCIRPSGPYRTSSVMPSLSPVAANVAAGDTSRKRKRRNP